MKNVLIGILVFVGLIIVGLALDYGGLHWMKFIGPKRQNVRREIFEETKSYVHGKIQDLAKYYKEYQEVDTDGKQAIEAIIKSQFAEFDETDIHVRELRQFLTNIRGY